MQKHLQVLNAQYELLGKKPKLEDSNLSKLELAISEGESYDQLSIIVDLVFAENQSYNWNITIMLLIKSFRWQDNLMGIKLMNCFQKYQRIDNQNKEYFLSHLIDYLSHKQLAISHQAVMFLGQIEIENQSYYQSLILTQMNQMFIHVDNQTLVQRIQANQDSILLKEAIENTVMEYQYNSIGNLEQFLKALEILVSQTKQFNEATEICHKCLQLPSKEARLRAISMFNQNFNTISFEKYITTLATLLYDESLEVCKITTDIIHKLVQETTDHEYLKQLLPLIFINQSQEELKERSIELVKKLNPQNEVKYINDQNFVIIANICYVRLHTKSNDVRKGALYTFARIITGNKVTLESYAKFIVFYQQLTNLILEIILNETSTNVIHFAWLCILQMMSDEYVSQKQKFSLENTLPILKGILKSIEKEYIHHNNFVVLYMMFTQNYEGIVPQIQQLNCIETLTLNAFKVNINKQNGKEDVQKQLCQYLIKLQIESKNSLPKVNNFDIIMDQSFIDYLKGNQQAQKLFEERLGRQWLNSKLK